MNRFLTKVMMVLAMVVVMFGHAEQVSALTFSGLIAYYKGDGNANDSVAGRNGTLVNGAGFDSGVVGQAFRFDGVNDFVSVADDDVWTFASNPFTIALWANFDVIKQETLFELPNVFIGHDEETVAPY